jgi:hypothetical protein
MAMSTSSFVQFECQQSVVRHIGRNLTKNVVPKLFVEGKSDARSKKQELQVIKRKPR